MGAAVVENMLVIGGGVGGVGRHGDAAGGHDPEIGDTPFGAVFGDQHHPVAIFETDALERFGEGRDLAGGFGPADRLPRAVDLGAEKRLVAALAGAVEEHGYQILILVYFQIAVFCSFRDHATLPLSCSGRAGLGLSATD